MVKPSLLKFKIAFRLLDYVEMYCTCFSPSFFSHLSSAQTSVPTTIVNLCRHPIIHCKIVSPLLSSFFEEKITFVASLNNRGINVDKYGIISHELYIIGKSVMISSFDSDSHCILRICHHVLFKIIIIIVSLYGTILFCAIPIFSYKKCRKS